MDIGKDIGSILGFSMVNWFKNSKLQKYLLVVVILYIIIGLIAIYGMATFFPSFTNANPNDLSIIYGLVSYMIFLMLAMIPIMLIMVYLSYQITAEGLAIVKRKSAKIDIIRYIKFLFFPLVACIYAFFSLLNIKFLAILAIAFILFVIGIIAAILNPIIGVLFAILGMIAFMIYYVVIIYNLIKLSFGEVAFVEGKGMVEAMKKSWSITTGNFWNFIIAIIIFGIIIYIIALVVQIPLLIYTFSIGFSSALSGTAVDSMALFSDPIYILLMIPSYIISGYFIIAGSMFMVKLYNAFDKKK